MPKRQKKTKLRRRLTDKEKKFFRYRGQGMTLEKAAVKAGYSENGAYEAGYLAQKRLAEKAPELFARHGLDDDSYIEKHLIPLLNATEAKYFAHNGKVRDKRIVKALSIRARMVELIAELKGMKIKGQDTPRMPIRVVVLNAAHRPPQPPLPPTPLLGMPKASQSGNGDAETHQFTAYLSVGGVPVGPTENKFSK